MLSLLHYKFICCCCKTRRKLLLKANMGESEMDTPTFLSQLHEYTVLVDRYYTPILCLLGAIGNSLSLLVFCLDSKYRSQSASYYLSALALSDTGYLLNLFAVWLESVKELVITSDFTCPLVMYLGQVTCFLSIYIIVAFSVERYRAVHYPLTRAQICTRSKARKIIAFLTVTALLLFSYAWVIAKVVQLDYYYYPEEDSEKEGTSEHQGVPQNNVYNNAVITYTPEYHHVYRCSVPEEYYQISEIANYLDTFITLIVPFLLITFFNVRISWSLWKFKDIRNEIIIGNAAANRHSNSLPTSTFSSENGSTAVTTGRKSCRSCFGRLLRKKTGMPRIEENELVDVMATSAHLTNSDRVTGDDMSLSGGENTSQICSVNQNLSPGCQQQQQQRAVAVQMSKISMTTASSEVRVAKTLLLVSSVFLLLNLPLHVIRCAQFIQSLTSSSQQHLPENVENAELEDAASFSSSSEDSFLPTAQLWANMLFNTNFAVNFLLYCASGRTFRKSLQNVVRHRILRRNQPSQQTTSSTFIGGAGPAAVVIANNANNRQIFCARATVTNEE